MNEYIVFNKGQIKLKNGKWKYEANVKWHITSEDNLYYFIGDDKFQKSKENIDYKIGDIARDFRKD